jgi:hypothetical protein
MKPTFRGVPVACGAAPPVVGLADEVVGLVEDELFDDLLLELQAATATTAATANAAETSFRLGITYSTLTFSTPPYGSGGKRHRPDDPA